MVFVAYVSLTWLEPCSELTWKLVVFSDNHYPKLWHTEVNCSCVSLPFSFLIKSYFSEPSVEVSALVTKVYYIKQL